MLYFTFFSPTCTSLWPSLGRYQHMVDRLRGAIVWSARDFSSFPSIGEVVGRKKNGSLIRYSYLISTLDAACWKSFSLHTASLICCGWDGKGAGCGRLLRPDVKNTLCVEDGQNCIVWGHTDTDQKRQGSGPWDGGGGCRRRCCSLSFGSSVM